MIALTPQLAARMLDVTERRARDPRGTLYVSTVLQAAYFGWPDFDLPRPTNPRSHRQAPGRQLLGDRPPKPRIA